MEFTAQELFDMLNDTDECQFIEAKKASDKSRSVMETVCAFANEPNAGGGYLLLGVAQSEHPDLQRYEVSGIVDTDKMQQDVASQCNTIFNKPLRVEMQVEKLEGRNVIVLFVPELSHKQKPLYFLKEGFPKGAYRRIGTSDERTYDQLVINGSSLEDVDEKAVEMYRRLRARVNPEAEELTGLLLFGSSKAQRRFLPMFRTDYIRVPGNSWMESAELRFRTIDMRGPLLSLIYRLVDAVNADLPKGFLLSEVALQAESVGLPMAVLREAIVNALMHCSYREQRPIQIRRYDNRIEIENSGYSLKPEDELGQPGSIPRNPALAQVLHDTNLAETKGSGIRAMRRLMKAAHMAPPSFESNRKGNSFKSILLLHHFLNPDDLNWLASFEASELNDAQKIALIFIRELGAIDNATYRQLGGCDTLKASADLIKLRQLGLVISKKGGRSTYYVASDNLSTSYSLNQNTHGESQNTHSDSKQSQDESRSNRDSLWNELPDEIRLRIDLLKAREINREKVESTILCLCKLRAFQAWEIALLMKRQENELKRRYLARLVLEGKLKLTIPEMLRHPQQAYITVKMDKD